MTPIWTEFAFPQSPGCDPVIVLLRCRQHHKVLMKSEGVWGMAVLEVDAHWVRDALLDDDELALIDTREEGVYGASHILRAVNIPLSFLEIDLRRLVPNKEVRFVLMDDDPVRLWKAVSIVGNAGYHNLHILAGGSQSWGDAGYELFSGLNVPSKVFGEYIEHTYDTPRIEASDLKALMEQGQEIVILDSRPMDEFNAMNIPGGVDMPGAELVLRARETVPNDEALVIVNCAGRTRSIIGCQSLVNAGLPNKVMALKDGTMGWHLAGLDLERGATRAAPPPSATTLEWAKKAAQRVSDKFGVQTIGRETMEKWVADKTHTTFVLDVRSEEEYAAGHLEGSMHAPGGQLVQATDDYVGVQNARIVLVDDVEVRARMTASWLIQMGWPHVYVLSGGVGASNLVSGPPRLQVPEADALNVPGLTPQQVMALKDPAILDLSSSVQHRKSHIAGARWAIRSGLERDLDLKAIARNTLVFSGRNDALCRMAAGDVRKLGHSDVAVLVGGHDAWAAADGELEVGMADPVSPLPAEDLYYRPYDREHGVEQAMQAYLDWEVALVEQLKRDRTLTFPSFTNDD